MAVYMKSVKHKVKGVSLEKKELALPLLSVSPIANFAKSTGVLGQ